jgi:hypothetical protein
MRGGNSSSGGAGELILKGKGLTSIPAEVWQVSTLKLGVSMRDSLLTMHQQRAWVR